MTSPKVKFAKAIERRGWTQAEAARALDMHRTTLNVVLNGGTITPRLAVRIEAVVGISALALLEEQMGIDLSIARKEQAAWVAKARKNGPQQDTP